MAKKECRFDGCHRESKAFGLCQAHYHQQHQGKELTPLRDWKHRPAAPEGYVYCNSCETFKKEEDFFLTPKGKPRYMCKVCQVEYNRRRIAGEAA